MQDSQALAIIRNGTWPAANEIVPRHLQRQFPHYALDVIDLRHWIMRQPGLLLANSLAVAREYGADILGRRRSFRDCFQRTTFFFEAARRHIRAQLARRPYQFSFQMQSLVDGGSPGLPHYVYTDHTHLVNLRYDGFDQRKLYSAGWIDLEKTIYRHADMIFTRSTHIQQSLIEQYDCPPDKVACVYFGSNVTSARPMDPARYAQKRILFVGIDWQRKGGPDLIEAFRIVRRAHPQAHLTIVGCSPTVTMPNVDIIGRVPLERVRPYYEQASIFCLPTTLEPAGVVLIEAMAHSLPIVATRIGAIPDFIRDGETGYMVPPRSPEALAQALIRLLDNPEHCQELGAQGRRLAEERYNWESVAAAIKTHILTSLHLSMAMPEATR